MASQKLSFTVICPKNEKSEKVEFTFVIDEYPDRIEINLDRIIGCTADIFKYDPSRPINCDYSCTDDLIKKTQNAVNMAIKLAQDRRE